MFCVACHSAFTNIPYILVYLINIVLGNSVDVPSNFTE